MSSQQIAQALRLTIQRGAPAGAGPQTKEESIISAPYVLRDATGVVHWDAIEALMDAQALAALVAHKTQASANAAAAQPFKVATVTEPVVLPFTPCMSAVVDRVTLPGLMGFGMPPTWDDPCC